MAGWPFGVIRPCRHLYLGGVAADQFAGITQRPGQVLGVSRFP